MKATNEQILRAVPALQQLTRANGIRGRAAFRLAMLVGAIEPVLRAYNSARDGLVKEYAKLNEEGRPATEQRDGAEVFVFRNEDAEARFVAKIQELAATEVELSAEPLRVEDIEAAELVADEEGNAPPAPWAIFAALHPAFVVDAETPAGV